MAIGRVAVSSTLAVALALTAQPLPAHAEQAVDAQLFKPALDDKGIFNLEGARSLRQWDLAVRLSSNFAYAPLMLDSVAAPGRDVVIDYTLGFNVGLALGLTNRLTLGIDVPFGRQGLGNGYGVAGTYVSNPGSIAELIPGTGFYTTRGNQNADPSPSPVGDVRVGLKYQLTRGLTRLAVQGVAYVPYGDEDVFAGSKSFTFEPKVLLERSFGEKVLLAFNGGVRLREGTLAATDAIDSSGHFVLDEGGDTVAVPLLYVGTEAALGLATKVNITRRVAMAAELTGLIPIAKAKEADCPSATCRNGDLTADALVGTLIGLSSEVTLGLAAGAGLGFVTDAARSEDFRVVTSLGWSPLPASEKGRTGSDSDADDVPNGIDLCPTEPEDLDGFQDDDGCPELDNDIDGVLDAQDACLSEPEDPDGFKDDDGCPDPDNDGDGVGDFADRCPNEPEDKDDFQSEDGCPEGDNDGDGIPDAQDKCPNEPETINGYEEDDGCPDLALKGGPNLEADRIDLRGERIEFEGRTARIAKESEATLDLIAALMTSSKQGQLRFRIEVGVERSSDSKVSRARDLKLTQERATAVYQYLLAKGVAPMQLAAVGLGSDRPIDTKNPAAPELNRRVDFIRITQ